MNIHKVAALLFVLMAGTLAYAATQLTINNTGLVPSTGTNLAFSPVTVIQPVCASESYSEASQSIDWGTFEFGVNTRYFCVKNNGNAQHTLAISGTPSIGTGTAIPATGTLPVLGTTLVTMTWTISTSTPAGAATWTVTIS